jgi:hypothetical protein
LSLSAELGNSELSFGLRKERKRKKKSPRWMFCGGFRTRFHCLLIVARRPPSLHRILSNLRHRSLALLTFQSSRRSFAVWIEDQERGKAFRNCLESSQSRSQLFSLRWFVLFDFLSAAVMRRFVSDLCEFFDFLTSSVWSGLCRRLALPVSPHTRNRRLIVRETTFSLKRDGRLRQFLQGLRSVLVSDTIFVVKKTSTSN